MIVISLEMSDEPIFIIIFCFSLHHRNTKPNGNAITSMMKIYNAGKQLYKTIS
jgi:hypothetical protein